MALFYYQALERNGRKTKGMIEADSARHARQLLRGKELIPVHIEARMNTSSGGMLQRRRHAHRRVAAADLALFTRQLATLVQAAMPLETCLQAVSEQSEKLHVKSLGMALRSRIQEGYTLSDSLRARLLEGQPLNSGTEEFSYTAVSHPASGLYVVLRQPQALTQDTLNLLYTVCLSLFLLCILASVLMSLLLSRQMFLPIERIHSAIGEVVHNNLDVYVPHERNDELGQLAERFNGMLIALKKNQAQLLENQRELNEAQIRMLQAQLNPHFLCNTLDTMKWISKINSVPQVAVMSTNLADILRFCVSPEEFVPLRRELEILQRYVEIQRIRLSGSFAFSVEVPPELLDCPVPKMILQPIVENAMLHGLEGVEHGAISVRAETCRGVLSISVTDNGRGLPPELVGPYASRARELSRGHLGLYNVDTILRKHYGDRFGLYLRSRPDESGAVVTAALPIQNEEETIC